MEKWTERIKSSAFSFQELIELIHKYNGRTYITLKPFESSSTYLNDKRVKIIMRFQRGSHPGQGF